QVLGADGLRLWWTIRLPMIRPALTAAALLVYIFTFTSFGVILILGGVRYATLEVEIYRQATALFDLPTAAALSRVQIGAVLVMITVYTRLQRRTGGASPTASARIALRPAKLGDFALVGSQVLVIIVLIFTPLLALVARSVTGADGFTLNAYTALNETSRGSVLFVPPLQAIGTSLTFAAITAVFAVLLGVIAAYLLDESRGWATALLDPLFMLPLATSAVTLGFGFIIALDEPPVNLITSRWIIPIAHTIVALPFVVRSVLPALRAVPHSLRESATTLGAGPLTVLRTIDIPLISRGIVVGVTFAFTVSMGEFGATLFIPRPAEPTMPIVIFRLLGQPGLTNYTQALAMSVILVSVCGVAFILIERLRTAGVGEF
ncbi:MAG: ABC transporter permease subunit, partial [Chloroflexota bacterium]